MDEQKEKNGKKTQAMRYALIGLGVGAIGVAGYFSWKYFISGRKTTTAPDSSPDEPRRDNYLPPPDPPAPKPQRKNQPPAPKVRDEFPLKSGSKGARVKAIQEALIAQYGKTILPKYGADGDFGTETVNALKKLNLPVEIDENTFNVITSRSSVAPDKLAQEIYTALQSRDFNKALTALKKIRNKDEYTQVGNIFRTYFLRGVRQTLVNGTLNTFDNESQKQQLRLEFLRMGLRFDGTKWSLDGLSGLQLITIRPTRIWKDQQSFLDIAGRTVLGTEVKRQGKYSLFENGGRHFYVKTAHVSYL